MKGFSKPLVTGKEENTCFSIWDIYGTFGTYMRHLSGMFNIMLLFNEGCNEGYTGKRLENDQKIKG